MIPNVHFYLPSPSLGAFLVQCWARSASVHPQPSGSVSHRCFPIQKLWEGTDTANCKEDLLLCRPAMTSHSPGHPHCTSGKGWFPSGYCCQDKVLLSGQRNVLYMGFSSLRSQLALSKWVLTLTAYWTVKRLKRIQTGGLKAQDLISVWYQWPSYSLAASGPVFFSSLCTI